MVVAYTYGLVLQTNSLWTDTCNKSLFTFFSHRNIQLYATVYILHKHSFRVQTELNVSIDQRSNLDSRWSKLPFIFGLWNSILSQADLDLYRSRRHENATIEAPDSNFVKRAHGFILYWFENGPLYVQLGKDLLRYGRNTPPDLIFWKSHLGGRLRKDPRTLGVDFLDHNLLWSQKVHIKIFLMRGQTIFWAY